MQWHRKKGDKSNKKGDKSNIMLGHEPHTPLGPK
jgi:hypothetical protein